jgi:hypothetical protein
MLAGVNGDFDFYVGTWEVANRRLTARLAGSQDWEEFPARSVARPIFGGAGNLDEITFPTRGWSGLTLRLHNPQTDEWSLYWVGSTATAVEPPVVGRWNERGEFVGYCEDVHEGRPVRVRYLWSGISETTAHWEQAFSPDGGDTWETNWIMDSVRVA